MIKDYNSQGGRWKVYIKKCTIHNIFEKKNIKKYRKIEELLMKSYGVKRCNVPNVVKGKRALFSGLYSENEAVSKTTELKNIFNFLYIKI